MNLQPILKRQYQAGLDMLLPAIEACPASLWTSDGYTNPYWQVAYHTLFYTHLYLAQSETEFAPWEKHRDRHHRFGGEGVPSGLTPYTVEDMLEYGRWCRDMVDGAIDRLDLSVSESGFSWYRMPKLEHQLLNLRHLQHHTGQLTDRLRQATGLGIEWAGGGQR